MPYRAPQGNNEMSNLKLHPFRFIPPELPIQLGARCHGKRAFVKPQFRYILVSPVGDLCLELKFMGRRWSLKDLAPRVCKKGLTFYFAPQLKYDTSCPEKYTTSDCWLDK